MSKPRTVNSWFYRDELEIGLVGVERGEGPDRDAAERLLRKVAQWLRFDEEGHPGMVCVSLFRRDYEEFMRTYTALAAPVFAEIDELRSESHRLEREADALHVAIDRATERAEGGPIARVLARAELRRLARESDEVIRAMKANTALLEPYHKAVSETPRVAALIAEHERILETHCERRRREREERDARWYATIAAELAEDPSIAGAEISRRHGIPAADVYRLWRPLRERARQSLKGDKE